MFSLFLDYYEEYFLNPEEEEEVCKNNKNKTVQNKSKQANKKESNQNEIVQNKPSFYVYSVPTENRFSILDKSRAKF